MIKTTLSHEHATLPGAAAQALGVYEMMRRTRPSTREDLRNYVKVFLDLEVPDRRICPEHSSPMDYLWHSFTDGARPQGGTRGEEGTQVRGTSVGDEARHVRRLTSGETSFAPDCRSTIPTPLAPQASSLPAASADAVVWANRGGGKTQMAAIATLLDAVFKPHCQIRILAGSGEQSSRMYRYLVGFMRLGFEESLRGEILKSKCRLGNGASVEVLTQSATSVRGTHVQKLRCDEVELFDEDVFAAAKFTTQSTKDIVAAMELISTMHRPYGLMQREVTAAQKVGVPVFRWCLWETIEKCVDRNCSQCPLWGDCQGRAKAAGGYLKIDDCITQMRRSSRAGWESEMLCRRPSVDNVVFAEFDPALHVRPVDYDPNLPLYRTLDFGFVNPIVCLWLQMDDQGTVRVIDEYVRSRATIDVHAQEIQTRTPCPEERVAATFCDPAGAGPNDVTGTSTVRELRSLGIRTTYRRSSILEGIEQIRRAIRTSDGKCSLIISPNCPRLIEALQCYHYPDIGPTASSELPLKDGIYDHPIDALRYFFVNRQHGTPTTTRRY